MADKRQEADIDYDDDEDIVFDEDSPEITRELIDSGVLRRLPPEEERELIVQLKEAQENLRRGRPKLAQTKRQVTLRLDPEIIAHFKGDDPKGWQTRINDALLALVRSAS